MRPLGRDPAPDATAGGPYLPVKGTSRACMVRARRRTFRASGRRGSFGRRVGALNRWVVAAASVVVMAGLGSFNAWSVFRLPLSDLYGANVTDVNTAFFISSLVFGLVASGSALLVGREGPRAVGVAGSLLYVFGVSLSGLAGDSLSTLYLTYGILAAAGLGLTVMAPIAAHPAWFPQRPGFAYGVAFVGFGMGPLVNVPLMEWLLGATGGALGTFHILGILYAAAVGGAAWFVRYPPKHAAIAASWRTGAGRGSPNRGRARLAFAGRPQDLAVVRPVGRVFSQHDRRACDPLGRQGDGRRDRRRLVAMFCLQAASFSLMPTLGVGSGPCSATCAWW